MAGYKLNTKLLGNTYGIHRGFFNNYLFFILYFYKNIGTQHREQKSHIISLSSLLCLAVASVCRTTFRPLWQILKRKSPTSLHSRQKKTWWKSMDTPHHFSWIFIKPLQWASQMLHNQFMNPSKATVQAATSGGVWVSVFWWYLVCLLSHQNRVGSDTGWP